MVERTTLMVEAGYSITEGVLSPDECCRLGTALAEIPHGRAGARNLMSNLEVHRLASDPRILKLAEEALGGRAVPYRATSFHKSGRANWLVVWHQDTALPLSSRIDSGEWGPWSTKSGVLYSHAPA